MSTGPGNCYVTSEALYHLLGGKRAGWKPMVMHHEMVTHWYIQHASGFRLDATAKQFATPPDYSLARGCGFLTKRPSAAARKLMAAMLWRDSATLARRVHQ